MSDDFRTLPHSPEAERAILGGIVLSNTLIHEARALLQPEHFFGSPHRKIFEAMLSLAENNIELSPALLHEKCGEPVSFITNLTYGIPVSRSVAHYATVVREKALLRQIIKLTAKIQAQAIEGENAEEILSNAETEFFTLGVQAHLSARTTVKPYSRVAESVVELFEQWSNDEIVAIPTQIPELDRKLAYGGLSRQDFIILAARSSFGKTALALQIAVNTGRAGIPVLIFPLEMSAEKLFIRNLSSAAQVPHFQIAPWTFQNNSVRAGKILTGIPKLQDLPIQVDDQSYDLRRMCAVAREWKRKLKQKAGLIVIDYLQLANNKLDKRTRQEEVAGISTEVKRLAKELDVPIIGVSQFNRSPARENRRPELSDLRETGQLEQDADVVLFPWSEDGLKDVPVRAMKLYCAKQRNGAVGWQIDIDFDGEHQWFYTAEMYRGVA